MNDISKLEEFIGKSVDTWTPSDINDLLDKFPDILTNKTLLTILNNTENMEVKKTIKAAMLNLSIDLTNKRMREYLYELTHREDLVTAVLPIGDGITVSTKVE